MSDTIPLPAGFQSVTGILPENDRPVLAIRKSDDISCKFEIMTARYRIDYRPNSPWRDINGNAVGDSGDQILGWQYADSLLLPTR